MIPPCSFDSLHAPCTFDDVSLSYRPKPTPVRTQVVLPSHLAGDSHSDPKIRALSQQLKDIDHKIAHNELDIPPEGQRSPSPEPVYDRMGVRLNTREIRYKEKMLETRHRE